jgi:type I restriction-modification system DNA methylase subunit
MLNFSEKYNREHFNSFLINIFPFKLVNEPIKISDKNIFKNIQKIGHIEFEENIPVFEVQHISKNDPRIELTNQFFSIMSSFSIKKSLVIFFCADSEKYRFSLIESSLVWLSDSKIKREFSSPKRLSYLLGVDAKVHTPYNQFKNKVSNYKDLKSRFDKEVVTNEFFENYKNLFINLDKYLKLDKRFIKFSKKIKLNNSLFAKKLLGQIVFCYFLQKKKWLGAKKNVALDSGDQNFLRNKFNFIEFNKQNYFNDFLEPLFYLGLNFNNPNSFCEAVDCKIPYLNGGLFEPIEDYNWEKENLNIPNKIFSNKNNDGILDIFDLYNFTVDEHEDLDVEIAIDPEMLGNVFEKLLDIEKREEQGTYYTPKNLVLYMCRLSLVNYLDKNLKLKDAINLNLLFFDDTNLDELKKYFKEIDNLLKNISICDPCIGSGAFPVTMMNEVSKARCRLNKNQDSKEGEIYNYKKFFIQNNIYGVDIEPGAVEIAKLRLWLSLIVDIKDIKQIDSLPNLDYKIMQGDSLVYEYHGISFEKKNDDLFGPDEELETIINELQKKQNEYFNLKYLKSKISKRKEVQELLKKILNYALRQQKEKLNFNKNKDLKNSIENIEKSISELSNTYAVKDFFFWKLFFSKVFNEKNGFDIVIANPPYVFTRDVKWNKNYKKFIIKKYLNFEENKSSGRVQTNKINLYIIFQILSLKLINENGNVCFIIPNTVLRSVIHQNFRKFLLNNTNIKVIADLKSNAFVGVTTSPVIVLFNKKNNSHDKIKIIDTDFDYYKFVSLDKTHFISQNNLLNNPYYVFNIFLKEIDQKIILKIREDKILLKNICKKNGLIEGIVVKKDLIHSEKINDLCRRFIRGGNVKKYRIEYENEYLEYDRKKINRARPDELWRANKKIFIQRISGGNNPLVCSVDANKYLGFSSTNILLLKEEFEKEYSYELICTIINSKLINYFYSKNFSNSSEITVNITTSYLEEIPIPKINKQNSIIIKEINSNYKNIIQIKNQYDSVELDNLVFDLYNINKEERKIVLNEQ